MIKVSVILTVYNSANFLNEAIKSILNQTLDEFELIIVDDGSIDSSLEIIKKINDSRIRIIENIKNYGQSFSRNRAIEIASGKYIAIMDADDIMYPQRLERQVDFLERSGKVVCFSWAEIIDEKGAIIGQRNESSNSLLIKAKLIFECPLIHPTAMWRKDEFIKNNFWYNLEYKYSQDMELWNRVKNKFDIYTLNENLLKFRFRNSKSISFNKKEEQLFFASKITNREIKALGLNIKNPFKTKYLILRLIYIRLIYKKFKENYDINEFVIDYFRNILFPTEKKFISHRLRNFIKQKLIH